MFLPLIVLTSCSDPGDSTSPTATVPRGTTSTTDPYAVPATIDIPYLNRVFLALEKINGDATRLIVANRRITPEAAKLLDAILTAEEFETQADIWSQDAVDGFPTFKAVPGDRRTVVAQILTAREDCVAVEVERDYSPRLEEPRAPSVWRVTLVPEDRTQINPTGWVIALEGKQGERACA